MRVIMVTDQKRHLFHRLLIVKASKALVEGNRAEFEKVLGDFERNYLMEGLVRYREESFLELLGKYVLLGVAAGFNKAEELIAEAEKGGVRIIEVGDPYVPFYMTGTLFLEGKPVPKEIVKRLPDPIYDLNDEEYIAFLLRLFEHNHHFGIVSCAFEFFALREALYMGLLKPEKPEIWRDKSCFVGVAQLKGDIDDVDGEFKIACRDGWCVFYFRGSRKRLKEKLKEMGLSFP
ncbi:hypothetical protein [Thermococcus barossii]|uniref:Uncharacterized protein n=1 Tax=Thermococcus barossii TaxID=54077 RepID=A0A2Z2MKZ5_9EURY|nr:hypothetical protein [Thermococcus barossii]ASJ05415.1 hypothetical protein A3L01_08600 [Thermococcus barossii]